MVSIAALEVIAAVLVAAIFIWVRFASKRIPHGEARFDENGQMIDEE